MNKPIPMTQRLKIAILDDDGNGRVLGILRLERGHQLTIDQAEGGADAVLQRLCDKYNGMDRILRDAPAPDSNPMESWSQIVGRQDEGFADALVAAMEDDFGLEVSRA
ncbi:MAG: hypothetical protein AAF213_03210 [Pseudomonadota bacterium]